MERSRQVAGLIIGLLVLLLLQVSIAWAAPTTAEQARQVVANWIVLERQPLGARMSQQVKDVQTFADASGPLYYVVYLEPAGLVFVPGDDLVEPIIGFAPEAKTYDPSSDNPVGALVNQDIPGRLLALRQQVGQALVQKKEFMPAAESQTAQRKWIMLQQGQSPQDLMGDGLMSAGLANINDVYVTDLVQSRWNQRTVDDTPATPHCYDYYTNWGTPAVYYYCGCTATAMAQLMRKWKYPASPNVDTFTVTVGGSPAYATIRGGDGIGGAYQYDLMELDPLKNPTTETQRQAIGALTFDAGVASLMAYGTASSGAWLEDAATALKNTFKYSSAIVGRNIRNNNMSDPLNIPRLQLYNMVNTNLDAGHPVLFHISGAAGAHTIVGDGYGNHWGTWYHHLNMGWGGSQNLYYNLPTIDSNPAFNVITRCVYNIYVTGSGEIISGRVTNSCGAPVPGVTVTATGPGNPPAVTTSASGIYAFPKISANATYTIHVDGTGYTDQVISTGTSVDKTLETGNRWAVNFVVNRTPPGTQEYVLYSLGGLDLKASNAYSINNLSQIAGGMKTNNSKLNNNPCLWMETTARGNFAFLRWGEDVVDYGELLGINDNGSLAVGYAYKSTWPSGTQELPICISRSGQLLTLNYLTVPPDPSPFGRAYGVNSNGQIVGNTSFGTNDISPCIWPNVSATAQRIDNLGGTSGTAQTYATRINNAGWIVGMNYNKAFSWNGSSVSWLGPAGGNGLAACLNNLSPPTIVGLTGTVGYVGTRAVIFDGAAVTELSNTDSSANGINGQRQIVGQAKFGTRSRAFIYDQQGGLKDLNTLINEPDWELIAANDINDNGEIVGWGWYKCVIPFAYMLRPVYTITATAGAGGIIAPSGAVKVVRGEDMTFNIIPNDGFQIADVTVDGASQGAISTYTFTNVTAKHIIAATFKGGTTYTITASASWNGSISPSGAVKVNAGGSQGFNITANSGYQIADVKVDGASQGAISTYTFSNVTADHTISATFSPAGVTYTITATVGTGGTISPPGAVKVNSGGGQTFTITANSGYQIADVKVDTVSQGAISSYTFANVTSNRTIEASFTPITVTYTITASVGTGGTISPSGSVKVNSGGGQTFTITANSGYQIADVKVDTVSQGAISSYTFANVTSNRTIEASFTPITVTYTITASVGTGGTISPSGSVKVNSGGGQTFTITANSGYQIADVKVDSVSQGAISTYTFSNVTSNRTIDATFTPIVVTYTITASVGTGGTISPSGAVKVNAGGSQTFTIAANSGYKIDDVKVDTVSQGAISTYSFGNVTGNHTITASFVTQGTCKPFFDHFLGSSLGSSWIVKNPDPAYYSVGNSKLRTHTLPGDLYGGSNDYKNLFLIPNPMDKCDFQVTIKVSGFKPVDYFQQIGLIAYDDDDNYVMSSNIFYDTQYWELAQETNGTPEVYEDPTDAEVTAFYLRLVKVGNTYRQFFSLDGNKYQERNEAITYGNGAPKYLGFIALEGSGITATPIPVDIDYFSVDSLNTPGKKVMFGALDLLLLTD